VAEHISKEKFLKKLRDRWKRKVCWSYKQRLREPLSFPLLELSLDWPQDIADEELSAIQKEASELSEEAFDAWLSYWAEWTRQDRYEIAERMHWDDLDFAQSGKSSKRISLGNSHPDPVLLRGQVWSLRDLLRHWILTGLDLSNQELPIEEPRTQIKRVKIIADQVSLFRILKRE